MQIASLCRYPVKGLSPESLPFADLKARHGIALDRIYAITDGSFEFDENAPVSMPKTRFLMLAKYERLARLKTRLEPDTHTLAVEAEGMAKTFMLRESTGRQALSKFLTEYLDVELPGEAKVVHADGHQFTDVSVHSTMLMRSISLINLATVSDLAAHLGQRLDPLRFRANVYFDGAKPWSELDWIGRTLRCGDVFLTIVRRTRRCPATSVDLETGVRDINLPAAIRDYQNHTDCGIYADVMGNGRVRPGDVLQLVDN